AAKTFAISQRPTHEAGQALGYDEASMQATAAVMTEPEYRPREDEPFMNDRQLEYFRQKLLDWKDEILRESRETVTHLQSETQNRSDLSRRGAPGDGRGSGAPPPRPPAQADLQDRRRAGADRGSRLRLLRGDRRAHQPGPPGGPPHRHSEPRSPGTPRTPR